MLRQGSLYLPCSLFATVNRIGALRLCHFILHEHHLYCVHRTEKHYFTNQTMMVSNYPDFCLFKHSDVSYSSTSLIYFVAGCIHTQYTDVPVNCAPQIWTGNISVLSINLQNWDQWKWKSPHQYINLCKIQWLHPRCPLGMATGAHWLPNHAHALGEEGCPHKGTGLTCTQGWAPGSHTCSDSV